MKYENLRIVFFGTPDFSVASLDALVKSGANIVGVVTNVDKIAGRGNILTISPVKQYCLNNNLNILQPISMKNPQFIEDLKTLNADIQVVVAFRMMPEIVWNMPPLGTINLHGSLLPYYRGASPINAAIINGDTVTGVTTFRLKQVVDTGNLLLQEKVSIGIRDNAGTLHDKLMIIGANLLVKTIKGIADESIVEIPQEIIEASYAKKIFRENTLIDFDKDVVEVYNFIRGMSPYPGAYTMLDDKAIKLFEISYEKFNQIMTPGIFGSDGTSYLKFFARNGCIYVKELQMENKKRMDIVSFLNGYKFK